jgi:hypothetical protein
MSGKQQVDARFGNRVQRIDIAGDHVTLTVQSWKDDGFVSGDEQTYAREGGHWRLAHRPVEPEKAD